MQLTGGGAWRFSNAPRHSNLFCFLKFLIRYTFQRIDYSKIFFKTSAQPWKILGFLNILYTFQISEMNLIRNELKVQNV